MDEIDKQWQNKMNEFEILHKQLTEKINQKIDDKIDDMMDDKIKEISNIVSNNVTYRMVVAMKKIFPAHVFQQIETEGDNTAGLTNLPIEKPDGIPHSSDSQSNDNGKRTSILQNSSADMVTELNKIAVQKNTSTDPLHDNNTKGLSSVKE